MNVSSVLCQWISLLRNTCFFSTMVLAVSLASFNCSIGMIRMSFSKLHSVDPWKCCTNLHIGSFSLRWLLLLFIRMFSFVSLFPTYCFWCTIHSHIYITHLDVQFISWSIVYVLCVVLLRNSEPSTILLHHEHLLHFVTFFSILGELTPVPFLYFALTSKSAKLLFLLKMTWGRHWKALLHLLLV